MSWLGQDCPARQKGCSRAQGQLNAPKRFQEPILEAVRAQGTHLTLGGAREAIPVPGQARAPAWIQDRMFNPFWYTSGPSHNFPGAHFGASQ